LLTYQRTGAIIAAVTTSLPEKIGEERNWDYRFSWIRDSSMIITTLITLNHFNVAKRYMKFILNLVTYKDDMIQIMYGIRGEKKLTEETLDHLDGYEGSRPVRVGNAAYHQKQNDIYGVLLDVIHQHLKINNISVNEREEFWTVTRSVLKSVRENWNNPDKSIWEIRSQSKHFTFSKVLSWVAFDRGVKIAELFKQKTYANRWAEIRDTIKDNIMENGWNEEVKAFTQSYGSYYMDASNLLMERYGFIDADDPKYISTVKVTKQQLMKNGLMYRYRNKDDFGSPSVSFSICTFWMITSLYKIGEKEEACRLFENVLKHSNHLGLFSEDMDFDSKQLLGNFPQGYSHLALIESAIMLSGSEEDKESLNLNC
jgi:GH15 family glucan-1,4-alpha-glucosidase